MFPYEDRCSIKVKIDLGTFPGRDHIKKKPSKPVTSKKLLKYISIPMLLWQHDHFIDHVVKT